jgi:hypothetical protein
MARAADRRVTGLPRRAIAGIARRPATVVRLRLTGPLGMLTRRHALRVFPRRARSLLRTSQVAEEDIRASQADTRAEAAGTQAEAVDTGSLTPSEYRDSPLRIDLRVLHMVS